MKIKYPLDFSFHIDQIVWLDIVAFIWAVGYLVLEGQLMLQLAITVNDQSVLKKLKCLLSDR